MRPQRIEALFLRRCETSVRRIHGLGVPKLSCLVHLLPCQNRVREGSGPTSPRS